MASETLRQPESNSAAHNENIDYFSQRRFSSSSAAKIERVFPIRISNRPSRRTHVNIQEPYQATPSANSSLPGTTEVPNLSPADTSIGGFTPPSPSAASDGPPLVSAVNFAEASGLGKRYITKRFTCRTFDGDDSPASPQGQKLYSCDDEPIHIPGAIQPFGSLIALQENEKGQFLVRVASENSFAVIGFEPSALFELRCFTDVLTQKERADFLIRIRTLRVSDSTTNQDVFTISLTTLLGAPSPLFCAIHRGVGSPLIICEFELESALFNPARSHCSNVVEEVPQTVDRDTVEPACYVSSRRNAALHSLNLSRKFSRQLGSMELFSIFTEIQSQLSGASTLSALLELVVGLVYELTGFHRTMVYQFDEDASGCVRSELVDPQASIVRYKGLHFPAADIPKQARDLYMVNTIRILYDRDQETARLVCRSFEDASEPLDLKHSSLRAMSPIHLKYLENMGVQASMSISLMVRGKLWGLISCHHYGSSVPVSLPVRELCRGLGNIASMNIEKLMYSSRIQAQKPLARGSPKTKTSPSAYISASSSDLLNMFGADFGFLVIKGEARTIGKLIAYSESLALLHHIRKRAFTSVCSSHNIAADVKDIVYEPGFSIISGMLVIPLALSGSDFLVFFRQGKLKEMNWAGNPNKKTIRPGSSYLEPRSSFKRWSEIVVGMSREWTEDELESATILSTLYGRFIEVWRQKDATVQKNRMTRLLIRNAGHELRTPLNSIINYLEVALEETLDEQARTHLQMSLQASKSLVFVVNDLLNLTEVEDAEFNSYEADIDLRNMLCEVITAFEAESAKRYLKIELVADAFISWTVLSDPAGLRQVVSNLLANAIKHTVGAHVRVNMDEISTTEDSRTIEISFEDEGSGLSEQQLNNIFQSFERIMDEEDSDLNQTLDPAPTLEALGLGLAVTARFVRLNHGQIKISSDGEGKGTTVSITVPFRRPLQAGSEQRQQSPHTPLQTPHTDFNFGSLRIDSHVPTSSDFAGPETSPEQPKQDSALSSDLASDTSPPFDAGSAIPNASGSSVGRFPFPPSGAPSVPSLVILVAEDNPLNSRLLETRLRKRGHVVTVAVNGQDCFDSFIKNCNFDAILMDMQMPLVDGIGATRLIREAEEEKKLHVSGQENNTQRTPIIAVSASLKEHSRHEYISAGFDGWILKPIDFKRLESILAAVKDESLRGGLLYGEGIWDKGGWFAKTST